jgi:cell division protein FtsB
MFFRSFNQPTQTTTQTVFNTITSLKPSLMKTIKNNDRYALSSLISSHKIDINDSIYLDEYQNTLLHQAVLHKADNIIDYLMKQIDPEKQNQFGETPLDLAIKNHHTKIVKQLTESTKLKEDNLYLTSENKRLDEKVKTLECNNSKLLDANKCLTMKNNFLQIELDTEKKGKRRYETLESENKKLKTENEQLKSDKDILQKTVKTLKEFSKK